MNMVKYDAVVEEQEEFDPLESPLKTEAVNWAVCMNDIRVLRSYGLREDQALKLVSDSFSNHFIHHLHLKMKESKSQKWEDETIIRLTEKRAKKLVLKQNDELTIE